VVFQLKQVEDCQDRSTVTPPVLPIRDIRPAAGPTKHRQKSLGRTEGMVPDKPGLVHG
jgi:hypothetical protein